MSLLSLFMLRLQQPLEVVQPEESMSELTTTQAVRAYNTHPNVLNKLILMGRLKARKNSDGHWLAAR